METESRTRDPEVTRRNLMKQGAVGVLGATAAATAATLLTAGPASAADGDPIILGQENVASSPTQITVQDSGDFVEVFPSFGGVLRVDTSFQTRPAVVVTALSGTGISASGQANGITAGSDRGLGVLGISSLGIAVKGTTDVGTAMKAEVNELREGTAFEAVGPVKFSTSGVASIGASTDRVSVDPGVPVTSASKVLALLQGNPGNKAAVDWVEVDPVSNTFEIVLTKSPSHSVDVAWFLIS
jgi:hypothetical protein